MKKKQLTSVALKVDHVSKSFHLPLEKASGLKQAFINRMRGVKGYTEQKVLKDISFEIKKGEFFGIVGRNGSGKSTLLKLISQIYTPNKGKITVNGSLVPFIELGVGFNPELTGRENVYLNGAMLGFSRPEIDAMYDEIVEFAELHDFMDQKLKNYSSGMQVRLAFSVAIKAEGDILVLDEVLAVGDEAFQRKCYSFFAELKRKKKTVILVTHAMDNVTRFCDRAIMIDKGEIVKSGSVKAVSEHYTKINTEAIDQTEEKLPGKKSSSAYATVDVSLSDGNKVDKKIFSDAPEDKILNITTKITLKKDIDKNIFSSILIKNATGEIIARFASEDIKGGNELLSQPRKGEVIVMTSSIQNIFRDGEYSVAVSLKSIDFSEIYIDAEDKVSFSIAGSGGKGFLRPDNQTAIKKERA